MKLLVLDHGYVEFIEAWGTGKDGVNRYPIYEGQDLRDGHDYEVGIVESARMSTAGTFRDWSEDEKLIGTLFNHQANQSTPFEAAGMTIEVCAPIFIFREWHRHRTQSYNEASARYKPLKPLYYIPNSERMSISTNVTNKQAGGVAEFNHSAAVAWLQNLMNFYDNAEYLYQEALKAGIAKEIARLSMPVGHYSTMRATANLRNWLGFLTLRLDSKAQWEIRQYAEAVAQIVELHFPRTWSLFNAARS